MHSRLFLRFTGVLSPLAMRLVALACAVAVPLSVFGVLHHGRLSAVSAGLGNEASAVRWFAAADRLVNAAGSQPGGSAGITLEAAALGRSEAALSQIPSAVQATREIRAAAIRVAAGNGSAPAVSGLVDLVNRWFERVSDDSNLSFESHVALADAGDALDSSFFGGFAPLETAAASMQAALARGVPTERERILIAGQLERSRGPGHALASDMSGLFAQDAATRATLEPAWRRSASAAAVLDRDIAQLLLEPSPGSAPRLLSERRAFGAANAVYIDALETEGTRQAASIAANVRRTIVLDDALSTASVAFVLLAAWWAGALIGRRDRREVERLQDQARALAAELGRARAEHAQTLTEAQFDAIFDRSQMGIALLNARGAVVERNPALLRMLGADAPALIPDGDVRFQALLDGRTPTFQFEAFLASANPSFAWGRVTVSSVDVPRSESVVAIAIVEDITERKAVDDRLRHATIHDHLTGLPNRVQFLQRLEEVLRDPDEAAAHVVFFIDLDHFKAINDTLGHRAGDRTLLATAERLRASTREDDLVARLHGDEFAVLARRGGTPFAAHEAAERIRCGVSEPLDLDSTPIALSASVGIVDQLRGYAGAEEVLRDADFAMYDAKKLGRATVAAFSPDSQERVLSQMRLMADLPIGLAHDEFQVAYQPVVNLRSGRVEGFEALLRWNSPTLGPVAPADFIPIAEKCGAIGALGSLALESSCALLGCLDALGFAGLYANVNMSTTQLLKDDLLRDIGSALARHKIAPERLVLEITESGLGASKARAALVCADLRRVGVKICLDDFGTGDASLGSIQEMPLDMLKIDRSFVSGASGLPSEPLLQLLLTLARQLDLQTVAEGIETEEQRRTLTERGYSSAQGFLFSKALDAEGFVAWMRERRQRSEALAAAG